MPNESFKEKSYIQDYFKIFNGFEGKARVEKENVQISVVRDVQEQDANVPHEKEETQMLEHLKENFNSSFLCWILELLMDFLLRVMTDIKHVLVELGTIISENIEFLD